MYDAPIAQCVKKHFKTSKSISATAKVFGMCWATVKKLVTQRCFAYARKTPQHIAVRRRAMKALALRQKKKAHRTWPEFGSSSGIRTALFRSHGVLLSVRQIQRELHTAGLRPFKRPSTTTKSPVDVAKRRAFAVKYKNVDARLIVYSDESWLCCNEKTCPTQWAEKRTDVLSIEKKARWNVPSILIWASCGFNYKGPLIIFPSKVVDDEGDAKVFRLDSATYIRRCLSKIAGSLTGRIFQQDGARCHVAKSSLAYLRRKGISFFQDWPPYSADINQIEPIWNELKRRVGDECPLTTDELIASTRKAWSDLPQSLINAHAMHFHTALRKL